MMGNAFLAPQATDYFDRFDKPAETMFPVHAHGLKFFGPVSEASSEDITTIRHPIECRRLLRNLDRVHHRQQEDSSADSEIGDFRRQSCQGFVRLKHPHRIRYIMVRAPY